MSEQGPREGFTLLVGAPSGDRGLAEKILVQGGVAVATATVEEILTIPDLTPPLLVILDDTGTHEDRMGLLKGLRKHPPLVGVPILILAYDSDVDSYTTAITKGAAAYLPKPIYDEEFLEVVTRLSGWSGHSDHSERRRRVRRPIVMKIELDIRARKLKVPGTMLDASGGGCRVELSEPLEEELVKSDLVRVILNTPDDTTHVALGGEVRWYTTSTSGAPLIGVKFTGTTAMLAGKLLGFVSTGLT